MNDDDQVHNVVQGEVLANRPDPDTDTRADGIDRAGPMDSPGFTGPMDFPSPRPNLGPVGNGARQCEATAKGTGERCKKAAVKGTRHCATHGSGAPQVRRAAAVRVIEEKARARLARRDPAGFQTVDDPVMALRLLAGEYAELADELREDVERDGKTTTNFMGDERLSAAMDARMRTLDGLRRVVGDLQKAGVDPNRVEDIDLSTHTEWIEIRTATVESIRPFPEAFRAFVDAMAELEERLKARRAGQ